MTERLSKMRLPILCLVASAVFPSLGRAQAPVFEPRVTAGSAQPVLSVGEPMVLPVRDCCRKVAARRTLYPPVSGVVMLLGISPVVETA